MHTPQDEKDDPVWDLLKKAPPTEPSAFFSRNVTREVRKLEAARAESPVAAWLDWLKQPAVWQSAAAALAVGAAVLGLAVLPTLRQTGKTTSSGTVVEAVPAPAPQQPSTASEPEYDPASEIENLTYLGELMAVADPAMLDDDALADLLF